MSDATCPRCLKPVLEHEAHDCPMDVIKGVNLSGGVANIDDETMRAHIEHAIRCGFPQVGREREKPQVVALVGSGPSLNDTAEDLRRLIFEGALLITLNGAYHWCIERNLQPRAQIVLDGRESNARFVVPAIPRCNYYLASQCHPNVWKAVEGRENVFVFHAVTNSGTYAEVLDAFYGQGHWLPVTGGTTVATRAIGLLRSGGYMRFHLFGVDSCWKGDEHHALDQPENASDKRLAVTVNPTGRKDLARTFACAPWHLKQAEDFMQFLRFNGHAFRLNVHGDGLLAHVLTSMAQSADSEVEIESVEV